MAKINPKYFRLKTFIKNIKRKLQKIKNCNLVLNFSKTISNCNRENSLKHMIITDNHQNLNISIAFGLKSNEVINEILIISWFFLQFLFFGDFFGKLSKNLKISMSYCQNCSKES